jgi:adenosylcobinamide kinase/adenosylcobinamide-phosphate guanylyltransferase
MITLILGPVRSGKTARASALAQAGGKRVIVAVTAAVDPDDAEMRMRVERHRHDRPAEWIVVETATKAPLPALLRDAPADACVVVDALGTWIAALMHGRGDDAKTDPQGTAEALEQSGRELEAALGETAADVIIVAEEAGWGVVPAFASGRIFRDALGRLVQRIAASADRVELVVAGHALDVRALGTPITQLEELRRDPRIT